VVFCVLENSISRSLHLLAPAFCITHPVLLQEQKQWRWAGQGLWVTVRSAANNRKKISKNNDKQDRSLSLKDKRSGGSKYTVGIVPHGVSHLPFPSFPRKHSILMFLSVSQTAFRAPATVINRRKCFRNTSQKLHMILITSLHPEYNHKVTPSYKRGWLYSYWPYAQETFRVSTTMGEEVKRH
jgi:hypothetical protein